MMDPQKFDTTEVELPEVVTSALKARYGAVPAVSPETDRAILADAQRHLSARVPPVRRYRRWVSWRWAAIGSTIAAASVAMLVWTTQPMSPRSESPVALQSPLPQTDDNDVDRNGRVDILDAFAIARQIRSGDPRARDVNHDGRLDQQDVDLVAREAVML